MNSTHIWIQGIKFHRHNFDYCDDSEVDYKYVVNEFYLWITPPESTSAYNFRRRLILFWLEYVSSVLFAGEYVLFDVVVEFGALFVVA